MDKTNLKRFIIYASIIVILLVIIGITSGGNSNTGIIRNIITWPLYPFQKVVTVIGQKSGGIFQFFQDIEELNKKNQELSQRVEELEKENRELAYYKSENVELRESLNLKNQFINYESIGANIIAKETGNFFNVFTIDRGKQDGLYAGKKDGIYTYYPVIIGKGLVGKVEYSDDFTSKVVSIIDVDSVVSCIVSKTRDHVIVRGDLTLKDEGYCRMDYIYADSEIAPGDTVETSGLGGIYPRGILVGKVKQIKKIKDDIRRYAVIEPAVDFKRLQQIIVLKDKNK